MVKIGRVLHAGYLIQTEKASVLFDPLFESPFSRNCFAYPEVEFDFQAISQLRLDAIFISHHHDDHFTLESLKHLNRDIPIYFYSHIPETFDWIRKLGFKNVHALSLSKSVQIQDIFVTPLRALDKFVDCLFKIEIEDIKILNVVDSWIDWEMMEELKLAAPWDLVLWPFQTMRELEVIAPSRFTPSDQQIPSEHQEQLRVLNPKFLVPSSCQFIHEPWSWYRNSYFPISYEGFADQIDLLLPQTRVQRMEPSEVFTLTKKDLQFCENLKFVNLVDTTKVDYQYNSQNKISSTRDIAKYLGPLNQEQNQVVQEFLNTTLKRRYMDLDHESASYFCEPRRWRLCVYDHTGVCAEFDYKIEGAQIFKSDESFDQIDWLTEIPLSRLWGALVLGESLTSLYMRINDVKLSAHAEAEMQNVDINEDPLIRLLYADAECGYQRAQFLRICNQ